MFCLNLKQCLYVYIKFSPANCTAAWYVYILRSCFLNQLSSILFYYSLCLSPCLHCICTGYSWIKQHWIELNLTFQQIIWYLIFRFKKILTITLIDVTNMVLHPNVLSHLHIWSKKVHLNWGAHLKLCTFNIYKRYIRCVARCIAS